MAISNYVGEPGWSELGDIRLDDDGGTLPERIEGRIATLIEGGGLAPGARLPSERELARIFGVSRLAIREAAHRLEARGLVAIRRGAGCFVTAVPPTPSTVEPPPLPQAAADLDELADVRLLLEPAAAEWAARRADRTSVAVMLRIAQQFEAAVDAAGPRFDLLAASDVQLHLEIASAAENALLAQLVEQLHAVHRLQLEWSLRRPGRLVQTAAEHRRIVDAIAAGDAPAARAAMVAHVTAAAASFRSATVNASVD